MASPIIIPIASGKGGVGKTILTANLGLTLSRMKKVTVIVDLDLGGSNLHTCLGIKNSYMGLGGYITNRQGNKLESYLVKTPYDRLFLIPGDSLIPGSTNVNHFTKVKLMKELKNIEADYVLLDLGAGTTNLTTDFFLMSHSNIIVTIPEITAILNAYSFLKNAIYRLLILSFPKFSKERKYVTDTLTQKIEGSELNFIKLIEGIKSISTDSYKKAISTINMFIPKIIINKGKNVQSVKIASNLKKISKENLNIDIEYIGYVPEFPEVSLSILQRKPALLMLEGTEFEQALTDMVKHIYNFSNLTSIKFFEEENDDIDVILEKVTKDENENNK